MQPGSSEFHKYLRNKFPQRPGEPLIKGYLPRLSNSLRISKTRMQDLWYGSYGKCDDDFKRSEREKIFGSTPSLIQKNYEDLEEIRAIKQQIRKEILNELVGSFQKLLEAGA